MKVQVRRHEGPRTRVEVILDEESIGVVEAPDDIEAVVQRLADRVRKKCSGACYERALSHHETLRKSKGCDPTEITARAREAEKCARALEHV